MLNSIVQSAAFASGFSVGRGMTCVLQKFQVGDIVYADTPGLADIQLKRAAAAEIHKILHESRTLTLLFVVTLESGRVRPADVVTIQLVLGAMSETDTQNRFGIIINKVSQRALDNLKGADAAIITAASFQSENPNHQTRFIFYNPFNHDLEDADNVVGPPNEALDRFIAQIPPVTLLPENIVQIDTRDFQAEVTRKEEEIAALHHATQAQIAAMTDQFQQLQQQSVRDIAAAKQQNMERLQHLKGEISSMERSFKQKSAEQQRENQQIQNESKRVAAEQIRALESTQRQLQAAEEARRVESQARQRESIELREENKQTRATMDRQAANHASMARQQPDGVFRSFGGMIDSFFRF